MKLCANPACSVLVDRGRCAACARTADRQRGTAQARGYDSRWATYARQWRQRYTLCGMRADGQLYAEHSRCVQQGRVQTAECVDHIVPLSRGGAQYDPHNLQSLCVACNTAKGDR